jgi:hypothetical protein|tara:strand:+ start:452 stop:823 length:372 start_codon:yes stop_codon:yes gene_type:complete
MKELIKKKVLEKNWTFSEISNLNETVTILSNDIYSEMTLIEKFKLVHDLRIKDEYVGMHFDEILKETVMIVLSGEVAQTIRELLQGATISFGGNNNEISERSVGGESHKERPTNEKKSRLIEE